MSEPRQPDVASLHQRVQREAESEGLTELEPSFYRDVAELLGGLRRQEYDGVEDRIKGAMAEMATQLASLLLRARLEKASRSPEAAAARLLDEERYILDMERERREREEVVSSAIAGGRTKFLESLAYGHKTRRIPVRILRDVAEMTGVDAERYGPFRAEDVAVIPYDNAQALISQGAAAGVRLDG